MNPNAKHTDYHPLESPEWLDDAIERIRAEIAAAQEPKEPTAEYVVSDWWYGNRPIPPAELVGIYRRMKKRGDVQTDEPIGRGAPTTLTVIRGGKG